MIDEYEPRWLAEVQRLIDAGGKPATALTMLLIEHAEFKARCQATWSALSKIEDERDSWRRKANQFRTERDEVADAAARVLRLIDTTALDEVFDGTSYLWIARLREVLQNLGRMPAPGDPPDEKPSVSDRTEPRILRNAILCLDCDTVIESKHVHDFVRCACGKCAVDGGTEYLRWILATDAAFEDLSETEPIE